MAPSPRNLVAQNIKISAWFRTTSWLDREYLRNATRNRESQYRAANYRHSRTGKRNSVYIGAQTAKNRTEVLTHPTSGHQAGHCHASSFLHISAAQVCDIIYIINGVMFVCLYLCSVWPAKRLGRSRPNLTHALTSIQGVFPSRSMSRSFMYACGSDRITKHPERYAKATPGKRCSNYVRRTGETTPGERLRNSVRTMGNYSSSNEARRSKRRRRK